VELRLCELGSVGCDDCGSEAVAELHEPQAPSERGYWAFCLPCLTVDLLRRRLQAVARLPENVPAIFLHAA